MRGHRWRCRVQMTRTLGGSCTYYNTVGRCARPATDYQAKACCGAVHRCGHRTVDEDGMCSSKNVAFATKILMLIEIAEQSGSIETRPAILRRARERICGHE